MITDAQKAFIRQAADRYERPEFITTDPVQFPHCFTAKRDIEISGLLTALMSFGNRKQIITKAGSLHNIMQWQPYAYVVERVFECNFVYGDERSFYRMMSYADFRRIFDILYNVYSHYPDMENCVAGFSGSLMERMCHLLGVSPKSPQKKINMFLRWMVRRNSPVDFGIWTMFSPAELIIPLDTHVMQMACKMGITDSMTYSLATARKITAVLGEIFPGDPVRGDFSLFGAGV